MVFTQRSPPLPSPIQVSPWFKMVCKGWLVLSVKSDDQEVRSLVKMEFGKQNWTLTISYKTMLLPDSSPRSKGVGVRGRGLALAFCLEKRFEEHSLLSGPVVFSTVNRTCTGHTASQVISHILNTSASLIFYKVKPYLFMPVWNKPDGWFPSCPCSSGWEGQSSHYSQLGKSWASIHNQNHEQLRCWWGTIRSSPGPRCLRSTIHDGDICPLLSTDRTQGKVGAAKDFFLLCQLIWHVLLKIITCKHGL